jgi:hypothetical protein
MLESSRSDGCIIQILLIDMRPNDRLHIDMRLNQRLMIESRLDNGLIDDLLINDGLIDDGLNDGLINQLTTDDGLLYYMSLYNGSLNDMWLIDCLTIVSVSLDRAKVAWSHSHTTNQFYHCLLTSRDRMLDSSVERISQSISETSSR